VNNLPKVVTQQRRGRASNPRLLDRKSDALPLSHRATLNTSTIQNQARSQDCQKEEADRSRAPPLPLEVDPLNPARGSGGAL